MALQNKNHWLLALAYTLATVLDLLFVPSGALFGPFNLQLGVALAGLLLLGLRAAPYLLPGALLVGLLQLLFQRMIFLFHGVETRFQGF